MENYTHTDISNSGYFGPEGLMEEEASVPLEEIGHREGPFILYKSAGQLRNVVLKCIKAEHRDNPLYLDMLRKEYEIGRSLNHPNIREYHSLTEKPGLGLCIEMEWVDGDTLENLLPECRRNPVLCDRIARQILDAVRFMHLKQVMHRELKPTNILISHNGQNVKLIDFSLSDSDSHFILKGNAGTARYASPEQLEVRETDFRSDIYSIGVILLEMSGRGRYRRVAHRCLNRDPDRRFPDIDSLSKALFAPKQTRVAILAAVLVLAAALAWILVGIRPGNEDIDIGTIDEIFRQATDLVEESDVNLAP
ncbi:MAG: serine/threonine protein kinase [Candidatus Cryptobacteroides sp.]